MFERFLGGVVLLISFALRVIGFFGGILGAIAGFSDERPLLGIGAIVGGLALFGLGMALHGWAEERLA